MSEFLMDVYAFDVVEAIHQMFEDNPETEASYMCYLRNMSTTQKTAISVYAEERLDEMGRCVNCGCMLETHHGKEWHPETQDYEPYSVQYCPMCDMGENI